jgi:dihydropteroate synthase
MVVPRRTFTIPLPDGRIVALGPRTLVMGILNVTPDSFADGGRFASDAEAVAAGVALAEAGADIIDIGGESTRPGASPLPVEEELRRTVPIVRELARRVTVPLSIDTYKAAVARAALDVGAVLVNDVSGLLYDGELGRVAAEAHAALVLMHTRGRSADMYARASYADVIDEVAEELGAAATRATEAGVSREAIVLDPGIGFAKRAEHSLTLLAQLGHPSLEALDRPLLVGPSRKSFLQAALGARAPADREWGTAAAVTAAVLGGAHIVRVHGVAEMVQVVRVADAIRAAGERKGSGLFSRDRELQ